MSGDWTPFEIPILLGENGIDALTKPVYEKGVMRRCRNYHLGVNGSKKREGTQRYQANTTAMNGTEDVQSFAMYKWSGTRHLIGVAGGKMYRENSGAWTEIGSALTMTSGPDNSYRWTQFHDGTNANLIGTDGTNTPFKWNGSGNAAVLSGTPPTKAMDVEEFEGRVFAINTDAGPTITEFSDDGTEDSWGSGQAFHCSRASDGVALVKHTDSVLLAIHEESIHAIRFNFVETGLGNSYFIRDLVDGAHGSISKTSCINHRGWTYFVASDGIYRIPPAGAENQLPPPAEYISRPIEHFWRELNVTRIKYISAFARGRPWNEVVFLCTTGTNTQHNAVVVFNTEIAELYGPEVAWTIFDSVSGYHKYNCGIDWQDSSDRHITMLGGYDSVAWEAWGNGQYSTGYKDGGSVGQSITSELTTGYLACNMPSWTKGLRQFEFDMEIQGGRDFTLIVYGTNDATASVTKTSTVDAAGDALTTSFTFGSSFFAVDGVVDHAIEVNQSSRYFQASITEAAAAQPHSLHNMRLMHVPEFIGVH